MEVKVNWEETRNKKQETNKTQIAKLKGQARGKVKVNWTGDE